MAREKVISRNIKKTNIIIETPWRKIIITGVVLIILIVITEFIRNFLENKEIDNIFSYLKNTSFVYSLIIIIVLIIIFLVFKRIKNFKKSKGETAKVKEEDVKKVLTIVDKLLDKLPQKEIDKFSGTKNAELYKTLLKKYGCKNGVIR